MDEPVVVVIPESGETKPENTPAVALPITADLALLVGELKAQVENLTARLIEAESKCENQKVAIDYLQTDISELRNKQIPEPVVIAEPEPVIIPEPEPVIEQEPDALPEIEILHEEVPEIEKEVIKRKRFFI